MADEMATHLPPHFARLFAAIRDFAGRPSDSWSPPDELVRLRHAIDLLELEFSQMAARFAAAEEAYLGFGSEGAVYWIRHECKMAASTTVDRITVGQQLAALPQAVAAVRTSDIGFAHLSVIAHTANAVTQAGRPFDETRLLRQAQRLSVGQLRRLAVHYRHAQDPTGMTAEEAAAARERSLTLSPLADGSLLLTGWFDAAGGAAIRTALEPLARPTGKPDERGRERRLADALVELAAHALDTGVLPQQGGQRPHLQVTASLDTLRGLLGSPAGDLEFTLPISSTTVQRLACDSSLLRVLMGAESVAEPRADPGPRRARRPKARALTRAREAVISAATRRALQARDGACRWPGRDRPASWSAAHHLVHWAQGGETTLANLVLLCYRHHWRVHEGGWKLAVNGDQVVTIPPADGLFQRARAPDSAAA